MNTLRHVGFCLIVLLWMAGCPDDDAQRGEGAAQSAGASPGSAGTTGGGTGLGGTMGTGTGSAAGAGSSGPADPADEPGAGAAGSFGGSAGAGSGTPPGGPQDAGAAEQGSACGSRGLGPCETAEFCNFPAQASCGEADAPGVCEAIPSGCTKELAPVCGCDGTTYSNACMAHAAGVSARREGACSGGGGGAGGDTCGGFIGAACADGQYCDYAAGDGCKVADGQGLCTPKPDICTAIYMPVCGCDGMTYASDCNAAAAGASIAHSGEC